MRNLPLRGITVVVTGTKITTTILSKVQSLGGEAHACPLIDTKEIIEPYDYIQLQMARNLDWLIFTSQNAVKAFLNKTKQNKMEPIEFKGKIAAVGKKTTQLLEQNGFNVDFMPSIYSADVFVKEFPVISGENPRCMFIRGKKAKDTLKKGLPFRIKEWNVYETVENIAMVEPLIHLIQTVEKPIVIFASPSAVDVYAKHVAPIIESSKVDLAAIGHITESAIHHYGMDVTYKPKTYTMESVIEEIVKKEDANL
ncbi:uroporphyrinogen-III synthase [Ureibacillus xyleni]|uniref:Uroporphyrinogen-III synthase n=1 Tax=Ureibacillus xyleni TaxID=614648 RepID=A0A285SB22_9BACL|nr:uroporphyrinogen-III synthase [Ureibacillus xyleni]SOC02625.1 uroporphyrinogen-III synthase [Ureibacillus xyleni]